jgi:hypothetical protein
MFSNPSPYRPFINLYHISSGTASSLPIVADLIGFPKQTALERDPSQNDDQESYYAIRHNSEQITLNKSEQPVNSVVLHRKSSHDNTSIFREEYAKSYSKKDLEEEKDI